MIKLEINVGANALVNEKTNLKKALRAVGTIVKRKARSLIKRGPPSKPGAPPSSRTGALRSSITSKLGKGGEAVIVKDTQFYAWFLEKGAKGGGGKKRTRNTRKRDGSISTFGTKRVLEPRPFMSVALEQTRDIIAKQLTDAAIRDIGIKKTKG